MNQTLQQIIAAEADRIRASLEGGRLYGEPIDMDDPDAVLVAAVFKAKREENQKAAMELDLLLALQA